MLERIFLQEGQWQHRDAAFYKCSLWDITDHIPATFQTDVLNRMRAITGLPLVNRVAITAQRMLPGQTIGIHSDRSLLGYEAVRLVLQLNKHWKTEHGGVLELFSSPESDVIFSVNPVYNEAFGFLLHANSYHGVTEANWPRETVVFNFWHAANTPELATHIQTLLANVNFSELPTELDPVASAAESTLPEEVTFRAGTAAIALHRWGYGAETVITGYRHSAGLSACSATDENIDTETYAAVLLADWVACLYRDSFDLTRWEILRRKLEGIKRFKRLTPTWQLCLPQP